MSVSSADPDILIKSYVAGVASWRLDPQAFVVAHSQVFEVIHSVVVKVLNNVFGSSFHGWQNLFEKLSLDLGVNSQVVDQVASRQLDCLHTRKEEGEDFIFHALVIILVNFRLNHNLKEVSPATFITVSLCRAITTLINDCLQNSSQAVVVSRVSTVTRRNSVVQKLRENYIDEQLGPHGSELVQAAHSLGDTDQF